MIQFDYYFSNGLFQPPTSKTFELIRVSSVEEKRFLEPNVHSVNFHLQLFARYVLVRKIRHEGSGFLGQNELI